MLDAPERAGQPGRPNPWADGRWDRLRRPALQSAPEVPAGPQPSAWSALWEPAGVLTIFLKHALDAVQQRWHVRDIRSTRISIRAQSPRRKFMARQIDLICAPQLMTAGAALTVHWADLAHCPRTSPVAVRDPDAGPPSSCRIRAADFRVAGQVQARSRLRPGRKRAWGPAVAEPGELGRV
jgi:hypothetical protein